MRFTFVNNSPLEICFGIIIVSTLLPNSYLKIIQESVTKLFIKVQQNKSKNSRSHHAGRTANEFLYYFSANPMKVTLYEGAKFPNKKVFSKKKFYFRVQFFLMYIHLPFEDQIKWQIGNKVTHNK